MPKATLSKPHSAPATGRKKFLLDRRNSTMGQVDNYRAQEQIDAMVAVAEKRHPGCEIEVIDEQGTSGSDLSKRHTFRDALRQIETGEAQGIIVYDITRLTRDQFGIDGGHIAKLLSEHHGIIVTLEKDYDPRRESDLTQYGIQTWLAGMDWRRIRNTMWSGLFKKATTDAVVRRAPLGYMTVREFTDSSAKVTKHVAKDPAHAHAMAGVQRAFEECNSLQAACAWLAEHGYERPPFKYNGKMVDYWSPRALKYMIDNELYCGVFVFGRDGNRNSTVWEATGRAEDGTIRTEVPHLAYWTASDAARWRRKFLSSWRSTLVHSRESKHPHPLTGVLNCATCGRPMVGAGAFGYRCQGVLTTQCDEWISTKALLKAVRPLLPKLLGQAEGLAAEWARQATGSHQETETERELAAVERRANGLRANLLLMDDPDPSLAGALNEANKRIKILKRRVQDEQAEAANAAETAALVDTLGALPHLIDTADAATVQRAYALLLRDLRLKGTGSRGGRRYEVVVAEPRLISLSDSSRPYTAPYASILADLAALLRSF